MLNIRSCYLNHLSVKRMPWHYNGLTLSYLFSPDPDWDIG